jgi:hypothetical protein
MNVVIETDAPLVQQAMMGEGEDMSVARCMIRELKELVRLNFNSFACVVQPRECKRAAHACPWVSVSLKMILP